MKREKVTLYELRDSETLEVFYVGITKCIRTRREQHETEKGSQHGRPFFITAVKTYPTRKQAERAETKHITRLRKQGETLLNSQNAEIQEVINQAHKDAKRRKIEETHERQFKNLLANNDLERRPT